MKFTKNITKMIIRYISYSESKERVDNYGLKRWVKYEAMAELDENDKDFEVAAELRDKIDRWHTGIANPGIFNPQPQFRPTPEAIPEKNLAHEKIEIEIDNCTTLGELLHISYPIELEGVYEAKRAELSKHFKKKSEIKSIIDKADQLTNR